MTVTAVGAPFVAGPAGVAAIQVSLPLARHRGPAPRILAGTSLLSVVRCLGLPILPVVKNARLRVIVTITGAERRMSIAYGELDPGSGNRDGLLMASAPGDAPGTTLVLPGDTSSRRTVRDVRGIDLHVVAVAPATALRDVVQITCGGRTRLLSLRDLAHLPVRSRTVRFRAGTQPRVYTQTGPSLTDVLTRAGIGSTAGSVVAVIGWDGYVSTVTPDEGVCAGRPVLLSISQDGVPLHRPRLIVEADHSGARAVRNVVQVIVG